MSSESEKPQKDGLKKPLILFLCFVLFYSAVGIPTYLLYRERQQREAEEEAEREAQKLREGEQKEREREFEDALRTKSTAPGGIHGPNVGKNPYLPNAQTGPRTPLDYLPPEQQRMLQSGRQNQGERRPGP